MLLSAGFFSVPISVLGSVLVSSLGSVSELVEGSFFASAILPSAGELVEKYPVIDKVWYQYVAPVGAYFISTGEAEEHERPVGHLNFRVSKCTV